MLEQSTGRGIESSETAQNEKYETETVRVAICQYYNIFYYNQIQKYPRVHSSWLINSTRFFRSLLNNKTYPLIIYRSYQKGT